MTGHSEAQELVAEHGPAGTSLPVLVAGDLVLFKGHRFVPIVMETVDSGRPRLALPFWPSDHAGVWVSFELK